MKRGPLTLNDRDILRHLRDLARHNPSADASSRALDATRRALIKTQSTNARKRFFLRLSIPSGIAACLIAALLLWLSQSQASASEQFQQAIAGAKTYNGWVHMVTTPAQSAGSGPTTGRMPLRITYHANASEGVMGEVREFADDTKITFRSIKSHTFEIYSKKNNELRRFTGAWGAGGREEEEHEMMPRDVMLPRAIEGTLAGIKATLGHDPVSLKKMRDSDGDRFDVTLFRSHEDEEAFHRRSPSAGTADALIPSHFSVWVNKDKSLTRLQFDGPSGPVTSSITYGGPEIHSIYDLGAPRNARVVETTTGEHEPDRDDRPREAHDRN